MSATPRIWESSRLLISMETAGVAVNSLPAINGPVEGKRYDERFATKRRE